MDSRSVRRPALLPRLSYRQWHVHHARPIRTTASARRRNFAAHPGPSFTCAQDGTLFFQVGDFPGVGRAFASAPGTNPALGDNCGQTVCFSWASPPTATLPMWILENFNNSMYAGTGSPAITGQAGAVWCLVDQRHR
jgi:hypothetical protein